VADADRKVKHLMQQGSGGVGSKALDGSGMKESTDFRIMNPFGGTAAYITHNEDKQSELMHQIKETIEIEGTEILMRSRNLVQGEGRNNNTSNQQQIAKTATASSSPKTGKSRRRRNNKKKGKGGAKAITTTGVSKEET